MRYHALACDYDGTLAHDGRLEDETAAALQLVRASGRKLIVVTGRRLDDLRDACPRLELFDAIVAENGALLHRPSSGEERSLAEPPPASFVEALRSRGLDPAVGRVIVATWEPHERVVLETIQSLGLELQVVFNKGAVMILPSGVNKATGLAAALEELGLSPHNCVAVGDAENDHALLAFAECGVAVANALPTLKERADLVTRGDHGAGVAELCARLVKDDLAGVDAPSLARHDLVLGTAIEGGAEVKLPVYGQSLLVAGTSGAGKSTIVTGLIEHLGERGYQHVIIDPEGDYGTYEGAVALGDEHRPPGVDEVLDLLAKPASNAVVNLLGLALEQRPAFFESLLPRLDELRARSGRPHWIVVDEAHHLLPRGRDATPPLPKDPGGFIYVTVHPEHVAAPILAAIDTALVIGQTPYETLREFAASGTGPPPARRIGALPPGEALVWRRSSAAAPQRLRPAASRTERRRHVRKYVEGELDAERSFYFRGPQGRLNLRAQNLLMFLQLADGVDAETWLFHLHAGEYSRWARDVLHDDQLATALAEIERGTLRDPEGRASRAAVREAIEARYTRSS